LTPDGFCAFEPFFGFGFCAFEPFFGFGFFAMPLSPVSDD